MSIILGIGAPCGRDPAAALFINGKLIACIEEERLVRIKHAPGLLAQNSIQFCLDSAGLAPRDVEHVAFPSTSKSSILSDTLSAIGIYRSRVKIHYIEHHLAHAASAYLLSGFRESGIMSSDGNGDGISMLIAHGNDGVIRKIKEFHMPHSLGLFYSAITEYLGFKPDDGEYKVMGMAPYGDPAKADLSFMLSYKDGELVVHKEKLSLENLAGHFGPPRADDGLSEPYIHIAAAAQKMLENTTIGLMNHYLGDILAQHKTLCLAGVCALNVKANQKILETALVRNLFVQPCSGDAGTPLGAAAYVASGLGEKIEPMTTVYYGPEFSNEQIEKVLKQHNVSYSYCLDAPARAAQMLADGEIVGWFQGRMEFAPRGLGNRSILGHPAIKGMSQRINKEIKFREPWRPFCPSVMEQYAKDIFDTDHPAPFMTISFQVNDQWRGRIPEVVHVDGSARPHVVTKASNPKFHSLLERFHEITGIPLVINTSLNRKGEPIACAPRDALTIFFGSGLPHIFIGDYLISK